MTANIIDRGRGPEIAGTRITVYDILDYARSDWQPSSVALWLGISTEQVEAAMRYIDEHREEVMSEYQQILARNARGNPPELQARLDANHARFMERVRQHRKTNGKGPLK